MSESMRLLFDVQPTAYYHGSENLLILPSDISSFLKKNSEPDIHTIDAILDVSVSNSAGPTCITKKDVTFFTDRAEQTLNVELRAASSLQGRFHILTAICQKGHKTKGLRVEYWNPYATPLPGEWVDKEFEEECPAFTSRAKLIFGIPRKTKKFTFDVFVRDLVEDWGIQDLPCDPQVGNDPP